MRVATYSLVPVDLLLGQLVRLGMLDEVGLQLGEDGLEFLQGSSLRHVCWGCGLLAVVAVAGCVESGVTTSVVGEMISCSG